MSTMEMFYSESVFPLSPVRADQSCALSLVFLFHHSLSNRGSCVQIAQSNTGAVLPGDQQPVITVYAGRRCDSCGNCPSGGVSISSSQLFFSRTRSLGDMTALAHDSPYDQRDFAPECSKALQPHCRCLLRVDLKQILL